MDFRTVADKSVKRPNFDVVELPSADLSLTGRFAHDECQAEGVDQVGVVGHGSLHHVMVSRSSLAESRLSDLELMDVAFRQVTVPNASWEQVTARRVEWIDCQAVGFQLGLTKAEDLYFEDCRLDYARLDVDQHRGVIVFHRCTFKEAVLDGDLSGIVFSECDFRGAEFRAHRAVRCDLTRSRLAGSSGLLTLAGAMITEEQAMALSGQIAAEVGFVVT
jgi:uncharacterized protein YjbI with pentapeptide repeats